MISPHPDDAPFSLGATIARSTSEGAEVTVLTVLGGDPDADAPAGDWDRLCGFQTAGQAAATRRAEETRACEILRVRGIQLPISDEQYLPQPDREMVWKAISGDLAGAETVLIPGWPLLQTDHRLVTEIALAHLEPDVQVGFYVDQPYAVWETAGPPGLRRLTHVLAQAARHRSVRRRQEPQLRPELAHRADGGLWETARAGPRAQLEKLRAAREYRSQLKGFGSFFVSQLMLYSWADGGEPILWAPT